VPGVVVGVDMGEGSKGEWPLSTVYGNWSATLTGHQGVDGDHGRIKTHTATVFDCLQQHHAWADLKSRYCVRSLNVPAQQLAALIRQHRTVENSLHRVSDMVFRGDASRVRTASAPDNFTTPQHMALKLRRASDRLSIQGSPQRPPHGMMTSWLDWALHGGSSPDCPDSY